MPFLISVTVQELLCSTKENAYYSCTVHVLVAVPYAIDLDAILDRPSTFCLDLVSLVFLARELYVFFDIRSQMRRLVIFCLLQVCL